jgi:hypothetical protein
MWTVNAGPKQSIQDKRLGKILKQEFCDLKIWKNLLNKTGLQILYGEYCQ